MAFVEEKKRKKCAQKIVVRFLTPCYASASEKVIPDVVIVGNERNPARFEEQLELPLDYSQSERAVPSRNPERWIGIRARRRQARLATSPTMPAPIDIALVSSSLENDNIGENNRQRQRFSLTPTLSTLITKANGKRWTYGYGATLPSLFRGPLALSGEGRAHERRRSPRRLPHSPLGVDGRRAGLPVLRLPRDLQLQGSPDLQVQGL